MHKYQIYGLGAALVDTEIEVTDGFLESASIEKGLMTLVDEVRQTELTHILKDHLVGSKRASGGSACNSIIAASYFGAKTFYSFRVANDDNGEFFLKDTKAAGTHMLEQTPPSGTTGKCLVMITPDAERTMNTYLGISAEVSEEDLDLDSLGQSEYFYTEGYLVTSPSGKAAAIKAREAAEANGTKTAISLSDPGMVTYFKEGLQEMIGESVDLLFCNKEEALGWTGDSDIEQAAETMKSTAKSFAITLGAEGALVFDGENMEKVAGSPATAIDTNGAGDMFAGAFLHAITSGKNYTDAALFANQAAAKVVSQYGPRLRPDQYEELLNAL